MVFCLGKSLLTSGLSIRIFFGIIDFLRFILFFGGFFKVFNALTDSGPNFGKLSSAENDDDDNQNNYQFRHAQSKHTLPHDQDDEWNNSKPPPMVTKKDIRVVSTFCQGSRELLECAVTDNALMLWATARL